MNDLILGVLIGVCVVMAEEAIFGGIGLVRNACRDRRDGKKIYEFLKSDPTYKFRTTVAIVSHTNIPEGRVVTLCLSHPKIRRNAQERESWTCTDWT